MTKNEPNKFDGSYYEYYFNISSNLIYVEPIEIISNFFNNRISNHIHNDLVQIFIVESNDATIRLENSETGISGNSLVLIPTSILHGFEWSTEAYGKVITIQKHYFDQYLKNSPILYDFFAEPKIISKVSSKIFENLIEILNCIEFDITNNLPEKDTMLNLKVGELLIKLYRNFHPHNTASKFLSNTSVLIMNEFRMLARKNNFKPLSINEYAKELGLTRSKLSRICNEVYKKSPSELIDEMILNEAKNLLIFSEQNISEISFKLNFTSQNYFTRFFKKYENESPKDFRNKHKRPKIKFS